MIKKYLFIILLFVVFLSACSSSNSDKEKDKLNNLFNEISKISSKEVLLVTDIFENNLSKSECLVELYNIEPSLDEVHNKIVSTKLVNQSNSNEYNRMKSQDELTIAFHKTMKEFALSNYNDSYIKPLKDIIAKQKKLHEDRKSEIESDIINTTKESMNKKGY